MRLLSIGNSFSMDAHRWLHMLAKEHGVQMECVNLYIGGCSLQTHWGNVQNNAADYELGLDGERTTNFVSIQQALEMGKWDVVTLQQASRFSGMPETYEPYLSELAALVRQYQPQAKLYFHQTWAYEVDVENPGYQNYNCSQQQMYKCIVAASDKAAASINAELIPVGTLIQYLRENVKEFDYRNGGMSLCRDGYHLSWYYGRFAAAATWLRKLTGIDVHPIPLEECEMHILQKIADAVNAIV